MIEGEADLAPYICSNNLQSYCNFLLQSIYKFMKTQKGRLPAGLFCLYMGV